MPLRALGALHSNMHSNTFSEHIQVPVHPERSVLFLLNSVLRNLAMLTARTELVMLGDLDMLIGTDLKEVVRNDDKCV
jgi:hypothetical protein